MSDRKAGKNMQEVLEMHKKMDRRAILIQLTAAATLIVVLFVVNWLGGNL